MEGTCTASRKSVGGGGERESFPMLTRPNTKEPTAPCARTARAVKLPKRSKLPEEDNHLTTGPPHNNVFFN